MKALLCEPVSSSYWTKFLLKRQVCGAVAGLPRRVSTRRLAAWKYWSTRKPDVTSDWPIVSRWRAVFSLGKSAVSPRVSTRRPNRVARVFSYSRLESRRRTVREPVLCSVAWAAAVPSRRARMAARRSSSVGWSAFFGGISRRVSWSMMSRASMTSGSVFSGNVNFSKERSPFWTSAAWHSRQ